MIMTMSNINAWQLGGINIKKTMPSSSSSQSSSITSSLSSPTSIIQSLSPSVLSMLKSGGLNKDIVQIKSQLLFSNLILAKTRPYSSSSSLSSLSMLSSLKATTSTLSNIYEKIQKVLNTTKSFLISLILSLLLFIKKKLGIKDVEVAKKEVIAINQDKDINEGRKWTTR